MAKSFKSKSPIRFDLSGFAGVEEVLQALGKKHGDTVERKLARAALGAALTKSAQLIRKAAPARTRIKKSIGTRFKKNKRSGVHEAKAGLNVGNKHGTAPHAHFFVLGTDYRFTKSGAARGKIIPNKFVRLAIAAGSSQIIKAMFQRIVARLPIEIDRLRRKSSGAKSTTSVFRGPMNNLPDNGYG
jgi:hypothetical protein